MTSETIKAVAEAVECAGHHTIPALAISSIALRAFLQSEAMQEVQVRLERIQGAGWPPSSIDAECALDVLAELEKEPGE